MTRLLDVAQLSVGYEGVAVVHDFDLRVDDGEVVALVGPNGAGKTTTLLAISGFLAPLSGTIRVLGTPVRPRRPHLTARLGVAHVPEDRSLFFGLTVRENLQLATRRARREITDVLDFFPELAGLLDRPAGLLSGGEQQMLALGRALVSAPRLLMVDELSLGLAPLITKRLVAVLRHVADNTGIGMLLVEQHVRLALDVADRALVISRGRVTYDGLASELADRPELLETSYLDTPSTAQTNPNSSRTESTRQETRHA